MKKNVANDISSKSNIVVLDWDNIDLSAFAVLIVHLEF